MAKEAPYFSHDYFSRSDPKMEALLMAKGVAGIGAFWCIIEMLYEEGGYLMLSECERIAFVLHCESDLVERVIQSNLFKKDDEKFWSESVLKRLKKRNDKSIKASESAYKRWEKPDNANALPAQSDSNAIKGKERKGKESINTPNKDEKKNNSAEPENKDQQVIRGTVEYDAEKVVLANQVDFQQICYCGNISIEQGKISLRKYHLHLEENEKYPKTRKSIFAGFEKWVRNEVNYKNNGRSYGHKENFIPGKSDPTGDKF